MRKKNNQKSVCIVRVCEVVVFFVFMSLLIYYFISNNHDYFWFNFFLRSVKDRELGPFLFLFFFAMEFSFLGDANRSNWQPQSKVMFEFHGPFCIPFYILLNRSTPSTLIIQRVNPLFQTGNYKIHTSITQET